MGVERGCPLGGGRQGQGHPGGTRAGRRELGGRRNLGGDVVSGTTPDAGLRPWRGIPQVGGEGGGEEPRPDSGVEVGTLPTPVLPTDRGLVPGRPVLPDPESMTPSTAPRRYPDPRRRLKRNLPHRPKPGSGESTLTPTRQSRPKCNTQRPAALGGERSLGRRTERGDPDGTGTGVTSNVDPVRTGGRDRESTHLRGTPCFSTHRDFGPRPSPDGP